MINRPKVICIITPATFAVEVVKPDLKNVKIY